MDQLTSMKLAELRQHDLRMDAARARLAAEARRGRRRRLLDWRGHITRRRRRGHGATVPAALAPRRSAPFDELATKRLADALLHASPTAEAGDPHAATRHHLLTS